MKKDNTVKIIMMCVTGILIAASGVIYKQSFIRILLLFVSLTVMYLQTKLNRNALLLGSLNSILYVVVYITFGLYGLAGYALLVSFPMQLVAYLKWNKKSYQDSTELRRLTLPERIGIFMAFIVCWFILYMVLASLNSGYLILDNTATLIGILGTILMIWAYVEYTWISLLSNIINVVLYVFMLEENPGQITYVIYSVYGLICALISVIYSQQLYREQQLYKK